MSTANNATSGHVADNPAAASTWAEGRVAGALLVFGALLLAVGNGLHPLDAEPSPTSRLPLADAATWIPIHVGLAIGFLAVTSGVAVLATTFRPGAAQAIGRVAAVVALVGGTLLFAVFGGLDGHGMSRLARDGSGLTSAAGDPLESIAVAIDVVDTGLAGMGVLALLGLALLVLGVAMHIDRRLSPWWALVTLILGVAGTIAGVALVSAGATPTTINLLLRPIGLATTIYFLALGVVLWRSTTV